MAAGIFDKTLYGQRRALIGWGGGIAVLVALMAAMWP